MIAAFDIGNTNVKALLFDAQNNILCKKTRPTPDLFDPPSWRAFFEELKSLHFGFASAEKRISCVNWKAFLALRVVFGYAAESNFDVNLPFDPSLRKLPSDSPFVFEQMIPLVFSNNTGLIGTDRLLAAYAIHKKDKESCFIASLGTATTFDLITAEGSFFSGVIMPGLDAAYSGLINRASHLPEFPQLPRAGKLLATNLGEALSSGSYIGHAVMLEGLFSRMRKDAALNGAVHLILTGGRAYSISTFVRIPHTIREDLVAQGLALLPTSKVVDKDLEVPQAPVPKEPLLVVSDKELNPPEPVPRQEKNKDIVDNNHSFPISSSSLFRVHLEENSSDDNINS